MSWTGFSQDPRHQSAETYPFLVATRQTSEDLNRMTNILLAIGYSDTAVGWMSSFFRQLNSRTLSCRTKFMQVESGGRTGHVERLGGLGTDKSNT